MENVKHVDEEELDWEDYDVNTDSYLRVVSNAALFNICKNQGPNIYVNEL